MKWKYIVNTGPTKALILDEDGYTVMEITLGRRFPDFENFVKGIVIDHNKREGA